MNPHLAKRVKKFDSSKIQEAFKLAKSNSELVDLSIGYPVDNTPDHIKRAGIEAIEKNFTSYTPVNGVVELRTAIVKKLARDNNIISGIENVTITPGASSAILLTYLATINPGDEILLPDPYFPPYKDLAEVVGGKIKYIDTAPTFQLTASLIERHIGPRSKILVINSPHNPTGAVYSKQNLLNIAKLAKKHNLLLISDEVYEYFIYGNQHFSIGSIYPNTLTINSLSKSYSMTGWRLGYINGPAQIIDAINELQQFVIFASSTIAQHAALVALKKAPQNLVKKYQHKRDLAKKLLKSSFPDINGGEGAFYLFLQLPTNVKGTLFAKRLAEKGIVVLPGSAFSRRNDYVRISFAVDEEYLRRGLLNLAKYTKSL